MSPPVGKAAPLMSDNSLAEAPDRNHEKLTPSRHRRVHKEVGAITGVTFIDHPKGHGVVVSELEVEGACARSGVRIGDHMKFSLHLRTQDFSIGTEASGAPLVGVEVMGAKKSLIGTSSTRKLDATGLGLEDSPCARRLKP